MRQQQYNFTMNLNAELNPQEDCFMESRLQEDFPCYPTRSLTSVFLWDHCLQSRENRKEVPVDVVVVHHADKEVRVLNLQHTTKVFIRYSHLKLQEPCFMKHLWGKCCLRGEKGMQVSIYLLMYVLAVSILTPQKTACQ